MNNIQHRLYYIALGTVALAFLALAITYSVVNPLHESTDEIRHYRYVRYLLAYHTLPVQEPHTPRSQSHHPPLYYTLAALASWWVEPDHPVYFSPPENPYWGYRYWEVGDDNKNQYLHGADEAFPYQGDALIAHLARWVNILIGLGSVLLTYRLGRVAFPRQPAVALGATAFVAFNPMFVYLSGTINNDIAAALAGAAVIVACAEIVTHGVTLRRALILGALYGLAILSKFNVAFILALIELTLLADAWQRRSGRDLIRANLAVLGVALLLSGWWFARNQILYGEPTGVQRVTELWGVRDPRSSWAVALSELPYVWTTLWGRFGYGQIPMPEWIYNALKIVAGLALVGLALHAARYMKRWRAAPAPKQLIPATAQGLILHLALLIASIVSFAGVLFGYMLISPAGPMGRFFFPALPALGVCMFYGLAGLLPARWTRWLAAACLLGMAGLSLYALIGILVPAYARPAPLSEQQIASIPHPAQATFGEQARLLGYDVSTDRLTPGAPSTEQAEGNTQNELVVTAYWQALAPSAQDLTVFVHLISRDGPLVAQRDTYPGLGRFPASLWKPGDTFSDRYRIVLDPYTFAPDAADVTIGLTIPGAGRLAVTDADERNIGATFTLTQVTIESPGGAYPNPVHINFDDKAAIVGYNLSPRSLYAGQPLTLTLYWQALAPMQYEYYVFAHVLGQDNKTWAADDGHPHTSPRRMWRWTSGQVYTDTRVLNLAPDTPPGLYPIELGLYGGPDEERVPIRASDGRPTDDYILLTQIRVRAP